MLRRPTRFSRTPRRLNESNGIADEFRTLQHLEISPITYYADSRYNSFRVDKFEEKLWDGKDISKELDDLDEKIKRYQKLGEKLIKINNNPELADEDVDYYIHEKSFRRYLDAAKKVYNYYSFKNETVQDIMHVIKPGEPMKSAIKKLVRMTKTVKGIDPETSKTYPFFDEYTEEDILEQIEEYDGVVKLNGSMDTYVKFEDGKAVGVYF